MTPRLAREWADQVKEAAEEAEDAESESEAESDVEEDEHHGHTHAPSPARSKGKGKGKAVPKAKGPSPRRHFYDAYKSMFYPEEDLENEGENEDDVAPKRNWGVMLTGVGVWAMVMMTG